MCMVCVCVYLCVRAHVYVVCMSVWAKSLGKNKLPRANADLCKAPRGRQVEFWGYWVAGKVTLVNYDKAQEKVGCYFCGFYKFRKLIRLPVRWCLGHLWLIRWLYAPLWQILWLLSNMPLNKTEDPGKISDSLYYLHLACATNVEKEIWFKMDSGLPVCEWVCVWGRGWGLGGVIGDGEARI